MNRIPTTRWSVVLRAGGADPELARRAIAFLCETYWYPVYAYFRRLGADRDAAGDLAQTLFADLIERGDFARPDPERGRFRDYLLGAARHLFLNARRERRMRDAKEIPIAIRSAEGEERLAVDPPSGASPEIDFLSSWARELVRVALDDVEAEYARRGDLAFFSDIVVFVTGDVHEPPYATIAHKFSKSVGGVKMAVHRLRVRVGEALRDRVAATAADEDVEDELRYLLMCLSPGGAP
jgi:RNA polymerase sigma factor (sigma-70 family)